MDGSSRLVDARRSWQQHPYGYYDLAAASLDGGAS